MRTCAAASAVGFAFGLFVSAYVDPVAIGWPLTPFIGAFWGGLVGGLLGGCLRLLLTLVDARRQVPGWVLAVGVLVTAVFASAALSAVVVLDGRVGLPVFLLAVLGSAALSAVVVLLRYARMARASARRTR